MNNSKIYILITFLGLVSLLFVGVVKAVDQNFIANEDITIKEVNMDSTSTDLLVFASSTAGSINYSSGIFTVTNPGSTFKVGSLNNEVKTITDKVEGNVVACAENNNPGISNVTLTDTVATHTITPSNSVTDCNNYCKSVAHASSYNSFPTCGAASCESGYSLSGSGSNATCEVDSSSGGGGGVPTTDSSSDSEDDNAETEQTYEKTPEDVEIKTDKKIIRKDNVSTEIKAKTTFKLKNASTTQDQKIQLNTSESSKIKRVEINIPNEVLNNLVSKHGTSSGVEVEILSHEASQEQKSHRARDGMFLVGFDIFSININIDKNKIEKVSSPITVTYDVSGIECKEKLKIFYFDIDKGKWKTVDDGGALKGDTLYAKVDHLTDFALMRQMQEVSQEEVLNDRALQWQQVLTDSDIVKESGNNLDVILKHNNVERNTGKQAKFMDKYTNTLIKKENSVSTAQKYSINNFIVYGTKSTQFLGAGERAGVVDSYKKAFGDWPKNKDEWRDCIAIANGRWPGQTSQKAEAEAKEEFEEIYSRRPDMNNENDNAAVTVIAYGLRPANRNMESESAASKIFRDIYNYSPTSALDWDIVRAIAYSGATR